MRTISRLIGALLVVFSASCTDDPAQSGTVEPVTDATVDTGAHQDAHPTPDDAPLDDALSTPDHRGDPPLVDRGADASDDRSHDAPSPDASDANDASDAKDASDATRDAPIVDAHNVTTDGQVCSAPERVVYTAPGCGAATPPSRCLGVADACAMELCDCEGHTLYGGCGFHTQPFRSVGACPDGGGAADARADHD